MRLEAVDVEAGLSLHGHAVGVVGGDLQALACGVVGGGAVVVLKGGDGAEVVEGRVGLK